MDRVEFRTVESELPGGNPGATVTAIEVLVNGVPLGLLWSRAGGSETTPLWVDDALFGGHWIDDAFFPGRPLWGEDAQTRAHRSRARGCRLRVRMGVSGAIQRRGQRVRLRHSIFIGPTRPLATAELARVDAAPVVRAGGVTRLSGREVIVCRGEARKRLARAAVAIVVAIAGLFPSRKRWRATPQSF